MGELVWAACVAHAGGQLRVLHSDTEQDAIDRVYAAWGRLRASLIDAAPDALIVVGTDHFHSFSYDMMPIYAIGRGEQFHTWGEFGTGDAVFPGSPTLADALHADLVRDGFDVAGCVEMRLDHAYSCPLAFLTPDADVPIVPLSVTAFVPPMSTLARCRRLGESLRRAIERQDLAGRVACVGTGGISHWIGLPETGRLSPEWDQHFLDLFEAGDVEALEAIGDEEINEQAGPSAGEIRSWMVTLGAAGSGGARRLTYEAMDAWITGVAYVDVSVS